jgi:hypothetical protein
LDTYSQVPTTMAVDDPLRLSVGFYERLKGIHEQKEFFANLGRQTDPPVSSEILTNQRKMSQALKSADRDLYYFYCHGYTEQIATDIQLEADLVGHFQLAAENLVSDSESLRDHLDDLFDVSDSWMRLTRGKLPLTMLKETVPDRFSRHPIVFMNMCESAQVLPSLSDGFVPFFIKRGARAVIGTECSMNTIFADDFARAFLTRFFKGESVGGILWALRRHYLEDKNPLALAYTLYCDADLCLSKAVLKRYKSINRKEKKMTEEARRDAVEVLWDDDMDGLMLTLAARVEAKEKGAAQNELQMWDPPEEVFAVDAEAGPEWTAMMKTLGQKWWSKLEPKLYDLLCNEENEDRDEFIEALKEGGKMLAIALAPALVAQVAALPAVAIVIATIAAKKIAESGLEAVCALWKESLEKQEEDQDLNVPG